MMRKIILVLVIIIGSVQLYAADGAATRVLNHRNWMKNNFPGKDSSLERKLEGVADILDFDLQEIECLALMEYMRDDCKDFAPYTPDLEEYLRNHGSNAIDDLGKWKRGAIGYFTEFAKNKLGNSHTVSIRLRMMQIEVEGNYCYVGDMATAFADSLRINYKEHPTRINREMLTVADLQAFMLRNVYTMETTPEDIIEIMRLEKDVLSAFPARSEDNSYWKANAYLMMGDIKSLIQDGERFDVTTMGTEYEMKVIPDNGTDYSSLGINRDVISNAPWYFIKAEETIEKLYTPNHPATNIYVYRAQSFNASNFALDSDFAEGLKDTYSYFKLYYPENNLNALSVRMNSWFNSLILNEQNQDLVNVDKLISVFKRIYGLDNRNYITQLLPLTVISIIVDPQSQQLNHTIYENNANLELSSVQKDINKFYLYDQLYSVNSETGRNGIAQLCDSFLKTEEYSYESARLGRSLTDFYAKGLNDYTTALNLANKTQQILLKCGGVSSPFFQIELRRYIDFAVGNGGEDSEEFLKLGQEFTRQADARYRKHFENSYKILELDYNYFTKRDYAKSEELARSLINATDMSRSDINYTKARLANSILNIRGKTEESDKLMADLLLKETELPGIERSTELLEEITQYYNDSFQLTEAKKAIEAALEANDAMTGGIFDDVYLHLRKWLATTLRTLGDKNTSRRIFSEDLDALERSPYYVPSVELLNYIWAGYYAAMEDNNEDYYLLYYFIQKFIKYMVPIYISSSDKDSFSLNYTVPFITELMNILLNMHNFMTTVNFANYPEESYKANLDSYNQLLELFKQMSEYYEEATLFDPGNIQSWHVANIAKFCCGLSRMADEIESDKVKAEKYLLKALEFFKGNEKGIAYVEFARANLYKKYGDWDKALKSFEVSRSYAEKSPYVSFDDRKYVPYFYFCCYKENGKNREAINAAKEFYEIMKGELDTQFQLMTITDQENFMSQHGDPASLMSLMLEYEPVELSKDVYDGVVYRTGMQLRSQQSTLRAIETSDDAELKTLAEELKRLRGEQSLQIMVNPTDEETKQAAERTRKIRRIEQQIFDLTADARKDVTKTVGWQDIRDALGVDEAAIEFVFSDNHILALILKPGCESPVCVKLAKHVELEEYLQGAGVRNSAALAKKLYGEGKTELYQLLWAPMEPVLKDVKTVFLSAPGILNSISFNALSMPDGGFIFDKYDIRQLTTTAELVNPHDDSVPKSALLAGEILFTSSQATQVGKMTDASREVDTDYALDDFEERGVARQYFRYLPFTGVEIDKIGESLKGVNIKEVRKGDATEGELRKYFAGTHEILHLATHGFFLASDAEAFKVPYMKRHSGNIGSSMQRAGIALAGAEEAWKGAELPDEDDGILTALEISQMNLKGTKLAVLSACETALGNYSFEGIYGLPRGLKQAGVQKLMVSLWSVNDHSTSLFMSKFYENWMQGSTPHGAYRSAVEAVRAIYPEPFNWAPFILLD